MTDVARLFGRSIQVLKPSRGGTGPRRWQTLVRIARHARKRNLVPVRGKVEVGVEYKWITGGRTLRVRIHGPDSSVVPTARVPNPNALAGWVVRIARGKRYMDAQGRLHPAGVVNPASRLFYEVLANETHIPIVPPAFFP